MVISSALGSMKDSIKIKRLATLIWILLRMNANLIRQDGNSISLSINLFLVIEKTFGSFQLSHTMAYIIYKENIVVSGKVVTFHS